VSYHVRKAYRKLKIGEVDLGQILNFENASSIGFKSGLYGGKKTNLQPTASKAFRALSLL
jgi:hypothetical protein